MRGKRAAINSLAGLLRELAVIICNLIVPRLILSHFGSSYNGLVSSVTQFLSYGVLLQAGVGGATRAALYGPLERGDTNKVSAIFNATRKFVKKVTRIFIVMIIVLSLCYPFLANQQFGYLFTASLVLIMAIETMANYIVSTSYVAFLNADQKRYIVSLTSIAATVLATILSSLLILLGASIHTVKLGSALVFSLQPFILYGYIRKKYDIDFEATPDNDAISQRWNSFIHQVAEFIHNNVDVVLLTIFDTFEEISVYAVYAMVLQGMKQLVSNVAIGLEAAFGNLIARNEKDELNRVFDMSETLVLFVSGVVFSCGIVLIVPFVLVYTKGITDANYSRPLFGTIFCLAELCFSVRIPYKFLVEASGHFGQTRNGAILEPIINLSISLILIVPYGMTGIVIGTLVAIIFRTVQYVTYASKHILERNLWAAVKKIIILIIGVFLSCVLASFISLNCSNYWEWIELAVIRGIIIVIVFLAMTFIFDRKNLVQIIGWVKRRLL